MSRCAVLCTRHASDIAQSGPEPPACAKSRQTGPGSVQAPRAMEAVGSNGPSAWLPGAAIGAGFGYASANIVGAMITAAGLALAFVTLRLDARERRHI